MDAQRPPEDTILANNMARTADNTYGLTILSQKADLILAALQEIDDKLATINSTISIEGGKIVDAINAHK